MITGIDKMKSLTKEGKKLNKAFLTISILSFSVLVISFFIPIPTQQYVTAAIMFLISTITSAFLMAYGQYITHELSFIEKEHREKGLHHVSNSAIRCIEKHNNQIKRKAL